jgi:hypothetical protein
LPQKNARQIQGKNLGQITAKFALQFLGQIWLGFALDFCPVFALHFSGANPRQIFRANQGQIRGQD